MPESRQVLGRLIVRILVQAECVALDREQEQRAREEHVMARGFALDAFLRGKVLRAPHLRG